MAYKVSIFKLDKARRLKVYRDRIKMREKLMCTNDGK